VTVHHAITCRCNIEQELSSRITAICAGGGLTCFRPLSEFVHDLEASLLSFPKRGPPQKKPEDQPFAAGPNHDELQQGKQRPESPAIADGPLMVENGVAHPPRAELHEAAAEPRGSYPKENVENGGGGAAEAYERGAPSRELPEKDVRMNWMQTSMDSLRVAATGTKSLDGAAAVEGFEEQRGVSQPGENGFSSGAVSGKRLREDGLEGGRSKAPRLAAKPGLVGSPGTSQGGPGLDREQFTEKSKRDSSRRPPFSPNLAAAFQIEERPEEESAGPLQTSAVGQEYRGEEYLGLGGGSVGERRLLGMEKMSEEGVGGDGGGGGRKRDRSSSADEQDKYDEKVSRLPTLVYFNFSLGTASMGSVDTSVEWRMYCGVRQTCHNVMRSCWANAGSLQESGYNETGWHSTPADFQTGFPAKDTDQ
jgi:hypothetical protein